MIKLPPPLKSSLLIATAMMLNLLSLQATAATTFCEKLISSQISYICETMTIGEPEINFQNWFSAGGIGLTSPNTGALITAACASGDLGGTVTTNIFYVDGTTEQINKGLSCQQNFGCGPACTSPPPPPPPPDDPPEYTEGNDNGAGS